MKISGFKVASRLGAFLVLAVLAGHLSACAQPPIPQDHFYRLSVPLPEVREDTTIISGTLQVERFAAEGVLSGRPLVYSDSDNPNELKEYYYHFWMEPPTVMLQNQLIKYMRNVNVAEVIVTPEIRANPSYVVSGKIRRMERVTGAESKIALELEMGLRDASTDRIVILDTYAVEAESEGPGVKGAVLAMDKVLVGLYQRFIDDIKKDLAKGKGAGS